MAGDDLIEQKEDAEVDKGAQARFADLFDVRRIIGGLFVVYGVLLFVLGLFASDEDIERAADVNINLWGGLVMALFGASFLAWALLRPVGTQVASGDDEGDGGGGAPDGGGEGPPSAPAPRGVDAAAIPAARSAAEAARRRERRRGEQR